MRAKTIAIVVAPLLVVGGTTAALAEGSARTARPTQTLHLRVVPISGFDTPDGYVAIDKDFNAKGKRVGSDVTTCRGRRTHSVWARCDVGLALSRGMLHITFRQREGESTSFGSVTGGTGAYRGVKGSVVIEERRRQADVVITLVR